MYKQTENAEKTTNSQGWLHTHDQILHLSSSDSHESWDCLFLKNMRLPRTLFLFFTVNVEDKLCRWLDSNRGPLESEALPTEPQSLHLFLFNFILFNNNFKVKIVDPCGIRTRIVRVEGEHTDNWTTSAAQICVILYMS